MQEELDQCQTACEEHCGCEFKWLFDGNHALRMFPLKVLVFSVNFRPARWVTFRGGGQFPILRR
jgi:hypothetical protein